MSCLSVASGQMGKDLHRRLHRPVTRTVEAGSPRQTVGVSSHSLVARNAVKPVSGARQHGLLSACGCLGSHVVAAAASRECRGACVCPGHRISPGGVKLVSASAIRAHPLHWATLPAPYYYYLCFAQFFGLPANPLSIYPASQPATNTHVSTPTMSWRGVGGSCVISPVLVSPFIPFLWALASLPPPWSVDFAYACMSCLIGQCR
ncbi:hypothetical protein B0T24DRAFT_388548 [Lasiosphaeria ovina]|uniref:Uncharacterized protein n=1 Tax=Lasiosphaeria ovina TaxID=92902 RepID=A0AAE0JZP0_9PEZI|nr:hypothetical protein B0T24DRAFT_388548 [Lasiosphaeria ovina]